MTTKEMEYGQDDKTVILNRQGEARAESPLTDFSAILSPNLIGPDPPTRTNSILLEPCLWPAFKSPSAMYR